MGILEEGQWALLFSVVRGESRNLATPTRFPLLVSFHESSKYHSEFLSFLPRVNAANAAKARSVVSHCGTPTVLLQADAMIEYLLSRGCLRLREDVL